jgi:hypothetical protein
MAAKKTEKTFDPLRLWAKVEETNPAHTKTVGQRGGFTAIDAQQQVLRATEQWGPMGIDWSFDATPIPAPEGLFCVYGALTYPDADTGRQGTVRQYGAARWGSGSEAAKSATTDALTKCLSLVGFNADVFLGRFDDNKYVAEMNEKFGNGKAAQPKPAPKKAAPKANGAEIIARHAKALSKTDAKLSGAQRQQAGDAALQRAIELGLKDADVKRIGAEAVKEMGFTASTEIPASKLDVLLAEIEKWEPRVKEEVPF